MLHRADFIKIDTDGHELQVIRGAHETVYKYLPCVIFESGLSNTLAIYSRHYCPTLREH